MGLARLVAGIEARAHVFDDCYQTAPVPISVVWVQQRPLAPKVRAFVDFVVDLCDPQPPWD
jgi:hypothetical protein